MSITFDPRAIEAKAKAAEALTKRRLVRFPRTLHNTDFAILCAGVAVAAFLLGFTLSASGI